MFCLIAWVCVRIIILKLFVRQWRVCLQLLKQLRDLQVSLNITARYSMKSILQSKPACLDLRYCWTSNRCQRLCDVFEHYVARVISWMYRWSLGPLIRDFALVSLSLFICLTQTHKHTQSHMQNHSWTHHHHLLFYPVKWLLSNCHFSSKSFHSCTVWQNAMDVFTLLYSKEPHCFESIENTLTPSVGFAV